MRKWNFIVLLLGHIRIVLGGCPAGSANLLHICGPATGSHQTRYTMDFSSFESTSETSCQCSFTAPSTGVFSMSPTAFLEVDKCGTTVILSVNGVQVNGGVAQCNRSPLLKNVQSRDKVEVKIANTTSSMRRSEYCYVATFPQNITFTCTTGEMTTTTNTTTQTHSTSSPTTHSPTKATALSSTRSESSTTTKSGIPENKPSTGHDNVQYIPLTIVIPAAIGGVLVVLIVVIVAVVCSRRSKSAKKTAGKGYENQNFNMEEQENNGLKDNILYKSADNGGYSDIGDGHYSSVIRRSAEIDDSSKNLDKSSSSLNKTPSEKKASGPVFVAVNKNEGESKKQGPPVSKKPSKDSQVKENEGEEIVVYAVPDKSKTRKARSNDYDFPPNNRPVPPIQPLRASNQDGLLYSEVEHVGPIPDLPTRKSDNTEQDCVTYSDIRTEL